MRATLVWVLSLLATPLLAQEPAELRLLRVTPSGVDVPAGRQIVFQFDRPVVPLGRMARDASEVPIHIAPDPGCDWRWLEPRALACQLGEQNALRKSTRYRIRIDAGLRSLDGAVFAQAHDREFITARPKIEYHWFEKWTSPGMPVLRATFNQAVAGLSQLGTFTSAF